AYSAAEIATCVANSKALKAQFLLHFIVPSEWSMESFKIEVMRFLNFVLLSWWRRARRNISIAAVPKVFTADLVVLQKKGRAKNSRAGTIPVKSPAARSK